MRKPPRGNTIFRKSLRPQRDGRRGGTRTHTCPKSPGGGRLRLGLVRGEPRQRDPGRGPFTLRCTNISILTPDILGSFCGKFSLFCGKFSVFSTPVHREAGVFCTAATVLFRPQQPGHRPRAAPRIRKKIMKNVCFGRSTCAESCSNTILRLRFL